ncbi:MAG: Flp family type IVb pilin [Bacillota bacterium]
MRKGVYAFVRKVQYVFQGRAVRVLHVGALVRDEKAQSMGEYALILALVAVAAILVFTNLGTAIKNKIQQLITGLG